jgi:hypothetical protein
LSPQIVAALLLLLEHQRLTQQAFSPCLVWVASLLIIREQPMLPMWCCMETRTDSRFSFTLPRHDDALGHTLQTYLSLTTQF